MVDRARSDFGTPPRPANRSANHGSTFQAQSDALIGPKVRFPEPFGEREALVWPQLETLMLEPHLTDLETHVALGHAPLPHPWVLRLISWLHPVPVSLSLRVISRYLGSRRVVEDETTQNQGAVLASVRQGDTVHTLSVLTRDLTAATAWLPALLANRWADGELIGKGLVHAAQVLSPTEGVRLAKRSSPFVFESQDGETTRSRSPAPGGSGRFERL